MLVRDLKKLLEDYADDAVVQINVSDENETMSLPDVSIDKEYSLGDGLVFNVSVEDGVFFERYNNELEEETI
ncbi:hypothetical protein [Poseidonibacter ostreae]|uniref:Uncharacterized protein n=1 Tax=Poseidonibacter ostreae TaxID=2654171 RepID=A0A6L4WWM9_9BACT|nr:hypothetical protein [Poseidonibacter ostreae]KAB7891452.1 hypothetical protein GBG19_01025 [Poseidonibacter ostreae]